MPQEQGYQPQVSPGGTSGIPLASAQDFGASVGQNVAALGEVLHEGAIQHYQIERRLAADQETTDVAARFAKLRAANDVAIQQRRDDPNAGPAGMTADIGKMLDAQKDGLLGGVTENSVRQNLQRQWDEYQASTLSSVDLHERGALIKKGADDYQTMVGVSRNRTASSDPNSDTYQQESRAVLDSLHSSNLPLEVKAKLERHAMAELDLGKLDSLINHGQPGAAVALLKGGHFDEYLSPEQIERARNDAEVELRRAEAVQAHAVALQTKAAKEAIATVEAQQSAGVVVPDATLSQAEQTAVALGDTSTGVRLHAMRIANGVNRATEPWLAQDYEKAISDLRAKGDKATPEEQIRLKQIEAIAPGRIEQINKNPGQWAASIGMPAPALSFTDPASIAARKQWATTVSQTMRRPVPLLQPSEVDQLRANFEDGPGGRASVINTVAPLGGRDAMQAMRQIAPHDDMAARTVLLQPTARGAALAGVEARKTHPELVDGTQKTVTTKLFNGRIGGAAALLDQGETAAVLDIARNIYADTAVKNGVQSFNQNLWNTSIHRALGGTRDAAGQWFGGVGSWHGTPLLLPPTMTQQQFEARLSGMQWAANAPNVPVFADGKTVMTPQQVRQYTPVVRPDGRYEFHGPNNVALHGRDGAIWTVDVTPKGIRR